MKQQKKVEEGITYNTIFIFIIYRELEKKEFIKETNQNLA